MTKTKLSRRRTIQILGASAGLPLLSHGASFADNIPLTEWSGQALGARSHILLAYADQERLRRTLAQVLDEIHRLENIFSLFIESSEISRLNRDGHLENPSLDFRIVLDEAKRIGDITKGTFDVSVQPLWRLLADQPSPKDSELKQTLALIDYRKLNIEKHQVNFDVPNMAITLNGIAQGFITDRAADILRNEGFDRTLVQLGETVALDPKREGAHWRIGVGPEAGDNQVLELSNRALATSAPKALSLGKDGITSHILDPKLGATNAAIESVSVVAAEAMTADALSTALVLIEKSKWSDVVTKAGADYALVQDGQGYWTRVEPVI